MPKLLVLMMTSVIKKAKSWDGLLKTSETSSVDLLHCVMWNRCAVVMYGFLGEHGLTDGEPGVLEGRNVCGGLRCWTPRLQGRTWYSLLSSYPLLTAATADRKMIHTFSHLP